MQTATVRERSAERQVVSARGPTQADSRVNVGDTERWLGGLAGGALALLGLSRRSPGGLLSALAGGALVYRAVTGHCPVYEAMGIDSSGRRRGPVASVRAGAGVKVEKSVTINRSPEDLFRFWRQLSNLPRFMSHLESVQETGPRSSHWIARGPLGVRVEWDAEIHNEEPDRLIAWRSVGESQVDTAGSVHFERATGGRGTTVRVALKYDPPAGKAGALLARLFGEAPEQQIQEELRCFKQLMEAGEIATIEGQTSCRAKA